MRVNNARYPHFTAARDRIFLSAPEGLISVKMDGSDQKTHLQKEASLSPFAIPSLRAYKTADDASAALVLSGGSLYRWFCHLPK